MRILHIVSSLEGCGGVQALLKNYYEQMDASKVQFDFIVHNKHTGDLESFFQEKGSKVFHIPSKSESLINNLKQMRAIIKEGNYDVVHCHQGIMSIFPMYFAKRAGVKKRIAHSHFANRKEGVRKKLTNQVLRFFLKRLATDWWACSEDAGRTLWGEEALQENKVHIMKNAIDVDKFVFDENKRNEMRKALGVEDKFVVGSVGRLTGQKNHLLLVEIFNQIYQLNPQAVLLIVGNGELEEEIRLKVKSLGLEQAVKFLGVRSDVEDVLQAMDVFLLPSKFEGLGIVYIEAQASGLVCFGSDVVVPKEAKVTELMHFISLEEPPKYWAEQILKYADGYTRINTAKEIKEKGFDIKEEARKLELAYE